MPASQQEYNDYESRNPGVTYARYLQAYGYTNTDPTRDENASYDNGAQSGRTTAPNNNDALSPSAYPDYATWYADWIKRNPGDESRAQAAYTSGVGGSGPDAQDPSYVPGSSVYDPATGGSANAGSGGSPSTSGNAALSSQLSQLLAALQGANTGSGADLSQLTPGDLPTFEVPGQNLGPTIDQTILNSMNSGTGINRRVINPDGSSQTVGSDPNDVLGISGYLSDLLARTAGGGVNSSRLNNRLEGARETLTGGETAALNDTRAALADRGLLSLPGSANGVETDATSRALLPIQQAYLGQARQAYEDESMQADNEELAAVQAATGWSKDQAAQRLAGAQTGDERQQMLSSIALQSLSQNMQWNQFLATFGLNREQVENEISQGRMDAVLPVLMQFMALLNSTRGGYV